LRGPVVRELLSPTITDGRALPKFPGPISMRLQDAYWALHDEPRHRDPVDYRN